MSPITLALGWYAPMLGGRPERSPDVFETLAPLLASRGHTCTTASTSANALVRPLDMTRALRRGRRDLDVAVVHVYSGRYFAVVDLLTLEAERLGIPVVAVLAGGGLPALACRRPRWVRRVLARPVAIVAPSPYLARFADDLGREASVIPNPLDPANYPGRVLTAATPTLLWLRAMHDVYDPVGAVRVVDELVRRGVDASMTMAGGDKGAGPEVAAEVARLGLAGRVHLAGFVGGEAKRRLWETHDVFLSTTTVDNAPVSLVEAGAAGLPVVSTRVGGVADLVTDGEEGLLVPPRSPAAAADAVQRLLTEPDLVRRLSDGGRRRAERSAPATVTDLWEELLHTVASGVCRGR